MNGLIASTAITLGPNARPTIEANVVKIPGAVASEAVLVDSMGVRPPNAALKAFLRQRRLAENPRLRLISARRPLLGRSGCPAAILGPPRQQSRLDSRSYRKKRAGLQPPRG